MYDNLNVEKSGLAKEEVLRLLSEIEKNPHSSQREISSRINLSLGKTNYLLNSLINKGILKIKSFSRNRGKLRKIEYILTPRGIEEKLRITYHFLKKKKNEYDYFRKQWEQLVGEVNKRGL